MTAIGIGLWLYATLPVSHARQDQSWAVAAVLIGLFLAVYAGRELLQSRR
jgi:ABC-type phosphate transport system permease subunit